MADLRRLISDSRLLERAGNFVEATDLLLSALESARFSDAACVRQEIRDLLDRSKRSLWPREIEYLREAIETLPPAARPELPDGSAAAVPPGQATCMLKCENPIAGRIVGSCQPLRVDVQPWGGAATLEHLAAGRASKQGFRLGVKAALGYLAANGTGTLDDAMVLHGHSCTGTLDHLRIPVDGASLALPAAMATLSAISQRGITPRTAFTGTVNAVGEIGGVDGVGPKVRAAVQRGVTTIVLPDTNQNDAQTYLPPGVEVIPVSSLSEVVTAVLGDDVVDLVMSHLAQLKGANSVKRGRPWLDRSRGSKEQKWLLSWVGTTDPFPAPRGERESESNGSQAEPGPILTCLDEFQPRRATLLYTTATRCDRRENMNAIIVLARKYFPKCEIEAVAIDKVDDPSDYAQLLPALKSWVEANARALLDDDSSLIVNLTSGTPQMETAWHLLIERKLVPGARRVQVRRQSDLSEHEPRVRYADPPIL